MTDRNKSAIVDALNQLASAKPTRTNGKITGVNLAKEAGVSKATLYRYLNAYAELRDAYNTLRKNGVQTDDVIPETLEQALRLATNEVKTLRSTLSSERAENERMTKLRASQVQLLWLEVERLQKENNRLTELGSSRVISFSTIDAE